MFFLNVDNQVIFVSIFIVYVMVAILMIIQLLLYGLRPTKTLAWLLAIFTIPVGGMLLYLLLGRNRRKRKLFQIKNAETIQSYLKDAESHYSPITADEYVEHKKLIRLITTICGFAPCTGNQLELLKNGEATFQAIFKSLKKAKRFIHLQYYIFEDGELAENLFELFEKKINEGVEIRILYDSIGSRSLSKKYIKKLQGIGVEIYGFLPLKFGKFLSSINYRNHRKIIIVDNKIAFTGGINVSDKYVVGDPDLGFWNDMHLQLEGPVVHSLQAIFVTDWFMISDHKDILDPKYFTKYREMGKMTVQTVHSGPDEDFSATRQLYFSLLNEAQRYVYIANPYIIPGDAILTALKVAALSGVEVRLLLSEVSDSMIVKWCVRSYFEDLLQAGVQIFLYPDGFVHSKIIVADDTVSSVGTSNLDIRSFEQNYEVNVAIYDDDFAINLKNDFLRDCNKSTPLDYETFIKRPWSEKIKEGIAKVFSPVL